MCSWMHTLYWYQLCKYRSFSLNWLIKCSHVLCEKQAVKFMALKSLVFLPQECFATNKQTHNEVKKIIKSSNNNFLPLVKHFLMTHCFETKNRLMQSWNLFVTFSAERMGQDLWVAADPATRGSGRSRGVPTPLIFGPKWGPKGQNKCFGGRLPPLPLSKGLDDHHPPPPLSQGLDPDWEVGGE